MTKRNTAILPIFLLMIVPALLPAADKAYVVAELKPAGKGVELVLRDLENEGKLFQLVVYQQDRLTDLAEGREVPGTGIRQGDILFLGKGKQMFIAPGRTVHARIASGQPEEARVINELSRRLARGDHGVGGKAGPVLDDGADDDLDRVRRSFLFVLEFALGAPFTAGQEKLILAQFSPDWWEDKAAGEKRTFGQYPQVVAWILRAPQKELEEMRRSLEETTRQWLEESPVSDPVVAMVRARLADRGRRVIAGEPPLTEMAAVAFSEITAYSRLLRRDGAALPEQVSAADVAAVRGQLLRAWPRFSVAEKSQVATAPGLWLVLRALVVHGDKAQRHSALERIASLTAAEAVPGKGRPAARGGDAVGSMIKHNVMMNIQQQTFNQYMWSRGFNYHPTYGKIW